MSGQFVFSASMLLVSLMWEWCNCVDKKIAYRWRRSETLPLKNKPIFQEMAKTAYLVNRQHLIIKPLSTLEIGQSFVKK